MENRTRLAREIAAAVKDRVGDDIAIIAKMSMTDNIKGSITLDDSLQSACLIDQEGNLDAILLTQGSSVYKQMWLFRGGSPVTSFLEKLPQPISAIGDVVANQVAGSYEYKDLYMLDDARQFLGEIKNSKLILLGGFNDYDNMTTGLEEGFDFLSMGRVLLRDPDLINQIEKDHSTRSRCDHNNGCMLSVFGTTHCIYKPDYAPLEKN